MNVVLLGPPGAGKGTQAKVLSQNLGAIHVSTGDMLREAVKKGTETGELAKSYMDKGDLVPDNVVIDLVIDRIAEADCREGFLLDGFPRTEEQAKMLDKALLKAGKKLDMVLYFKTSPAISIKRLSGRRVCKTCGANFHVKNMPPKKNGICDYCGAKLFQREDDKPETVKNRLVVYTNEIKSLIDFYREKHILKEVSGDLNVSELFLEIKKLFKSEGLV